GPDSEADGLPGEGSARRADERRRRGPGSNGTGPRVRLRHAQGVPRRERLPHLHGREPDEPLDVLRQPRPWLARYLPEGGPPGRGRHRLVRVPRPVAGRDAARPPGPRPADRGRLAPRRLLLFDADHRRPHRHLVGGAGAGGGRPPVGRRAGRPPLATVEPAAKLAPLAPAGDGGRRLPRLRVRAGPAPPPHDDAPRPRRQRPPPRRGDGAAGRL
ncbi:MAG: hypothetical protein AVDCRST_MAG59-1725, partial [uncultured Thermomicrobiales bacterium]